MTAHYQSLVSVSALAAHCDEPDWVVLDCRFDLFAPDAGRKQWQTAHIPGSVYADLERDLSRPRSNDGGRHPLPDAEQLAQRFSAWGIGPGTQVIAYDDNDSAIAARAWWLLRWLGHDHVAVLDGGLLAWRRAGLPLTKQVTQRPTQIFRPRLRNDMYIEADELSAAMNHGDLVLDARDAKRFLGDVEPLDARAGHIPGAHNFPYTANTDRHGRFLAASELRQCFDVALCGRPVHRVISMCGSGVTACHNLLAMEIAGLRGARLYPGSWSEWSGNTRRPVATGPDV